MHGREKGVLRIRICNVDLEIWIHDYEEIILVDPDVRS
jgi:hypothetical protein